MVIAQMYTYRISVLDIRLQNHRSLNILINNMQCSFFLNVVVLWLTRRSGNAEFTVGVKTGKAVSFLCCPWLILVQ